METLSPEQEEVLTKYCDEIFASGAETEEFSIAGYKDGLRLKSTVKSVVRNDVVKTKYTLELLVLENPLVVRIYALLFDVN